MGITDKDISIILPAKNEADGLVLLLPKLKKICKGAEIIVVDDGSTDNTFYVCQQHEVRIVRHPYSKGNGAAIKTGARAASREVLIFMDSDGQHKPEDIPRFMQEYDKGYAMVVGARDRTSQASVARGIGNAIYNRFASWMTEHKISDLTSGFRIVNAKKFRQFLYLLPNGFSYPTTITMAFYRAGYSVCFIPITALDRLGKSHLKISRDGIRFLLIIFKVGTLYSPLKVFVPISLCFFLLGSFYYFYTYTFLGRFTNMSALLISTSVIIFLIGLVSEQITTLTYQEPVTEIEKPHSKTESS